MGGGRPKSKGGLILGGLSWLYNKGKSAFGGSKSAVPSFANGVTRAMLQQAANDPGSKITLVTKLDSAPSLGKGLSVAFGEGAENLASGARGAGQTYTAQVPRALVERLRDAGLVVYESKTSWKGSTQFSGEMRFAPEAAEFLVNFFK